MNDKGNERIHNIRLDKDFTITSNKPPEELKVSWGAKGLLWYLLSRPADWSVHTWQLAKVYTGEKRGNGLPAVQGFIKELRAAGYIVYRKSRNAKGQWDHSYAVYPMPVEKYKEKFPERVKPDTAKPDSVKRDIFLTSTEPTSTELPSLTGSIGSPPKIKPPSPGKTKTFAPKVERAEHVSTTNDEHNRLVTDFGEDIVRRAYDTLSEWKHNKSAAKKRIDDNRAMRKWAVDSVLQQDLKRRELELKQKELDQREQRVKRIDSEANGKSTAKRPSQLNNANEGKDGSCVPKSRILRSNNTGDKK